MESAKRIAHATSSSPNPIVDALTSDPPSNDNTNATAAAPSLNEPWSVEQVLSTLPTPLPTNPTSPIPFLHTLERLKTTPREGWRRFHVQRSESIADHMYRMSILTLLAPPPLRSTLNIPHCTLLALVHDMAECLVGDLTPLDGVPKAEKSRRERSTMDFLTSSLLPPNPSSSSDSGSNANNNDDPRTLISSAWAEYEADTTPEARFVHDVDKLELLLQMVEYERRGDGAVDLGEFVHVARGIRLREMKAWCREVLRERRAFWEAKGKVPSCVADVEEILREGEEDGEEVREGEEEADGGKGGEAGKGP